MARCRWSCGIISTHHNTEPLHRFRDRFVSFGTEFRTPKAVVEEFAHWQSRPSDEVYPIVYLDAIVVKVHALFEKLASRGYPAGSPAARSTWPWG